MTEQPARKFYTPTPTLGADDRPTVRPPFDITAFARETGAPDAGRGPTSEPATRRRPKLREPEPEGPSSASALLGAIDNVEGPVITQRTDDPIVEMRECFSFGDYAGALALAELVLAAQPDNLLAQEFRTTCCAALEDVYDFLLGPLDRVPVVVTLPERTDRRATDHRTGLLLSLVDGSCTLRRIVDTSGMPKVDALKVLHDLVQRGTIGFESTR